MTTDIRMEAAKVWMTAIGNTDITVLNANVSPPGSLVDPYDTGSVSFPEEVIHLTADFMAAGYVVFSPNDEKSFKRYPSPSHWQMPAEKANDPEFIKKTTQQIIDNVEIVEFSEIPQSTLNTIAGLVKRKENN